MMIEIVLIGGAIIVGYLLGSIPTAVWIGKYFYQIDVREHGSKNAGATNTFRVLGIGIMGIITSQALSIVVSTPFALFAQSDVTQDPTTSSIFMSSMGSILGYTVMLPFIAAFTTLLYTDLRIRKENIATDLDKAKNQ
jgi:glycerol-3-phosphate acyltransferase PlsY